jgi:hypothetical protein
MTIDYIVGFHRNDIRGKELDVHFWEKSTSMPELVGSCSLSLSFDLFSCQQRIRQLASSSLHRHGMDLGHLHAFPPKGKWA